MRRMTLGAVAILLTLAACSGSEGDSATTTAAPEASTTAVATTAATTTTSATTTTTSAPTTTTTVAPQPPEGLATLSAAFSDATPIEVVVTGTHRPRFDWTSTAAADRYMTVVADDTGTVIWSWEGERGTVTVGSGEVDRDGLGGRLVRPGWLIVLGFGDEGDVIAISDAIPVGS